MRVRIWPSVGISFGVLLLLVPLFALLVSRKAAQIDARTREAHRLYQMANDAITDIRANIYKAALVMRDASREPNNASAEGQIAALRHTTARDCETLSSLLDATQHAQLVALRRGLNEYWESVSRSLEAVRANSGRGTFLSEPKNGPDEVLKLAERIDALNEANLSLEEQQIQT